MLFRKGVPVCASRDKASRLNLIKWYQMISALALSFGKESRPQDDFSPLKSPTDLFEKSVGFFRENPWDFGIFPGVSPNLKKVGSFHPLEAMASPYAPCGWIPLRYWTCEGHPAMVSRAGFKHQGFCCILQVFKMFILLALGWFMFVIWDTCSFWFLECLFWITLQVPYASFVKMS